MSSIKATKLDGDLSVGRNLSIGGKATIQGNSHLKGGLKVDGWLEAPNVKGPNKGIFSSLEKLKAEYPFPRNGWYALVGTSLPAPMYVGDNGDWVATEGTGGNMTADVQQFHDDLEALEDSFTGELTELDNKASSVGYVTCDTAASTAAKTIAVTGMTALSTGIRMLVKMSNNNTATNATLNINSLGAKPLYYNNVRVSGDNAWAAGEVVELYYDGTNFYSSNVLGGAGGGGNMILPWLTDVGTTRKQVKLADRKRLLQISYENGDGETINEQYIGTLFADTNWALDDNWEPIPSQQRVKKIEGYLHLDQKDVVRSNYLYDYSKHTVGSFAGWSTIMGEVMGGDTITIVANGSPKTGFRYGIGSGLGKDEEGKTILADLVSTSGNDNASSISIPTDKERYFIVVSFKEVTDDIQFVRQKELVSGLTASDIPLSDGSSVETLLPTKKLQEYIDTSEDVIIPKCAYNYITHEIYYDFEGWTALKGKIYGGDIVKFSIDEEETDCTWAMFADEELSELVSDSSSVTFAEIPKGQIFYLMAFKPKSVTNFKFIRKLGKPSGIYTNSIKTVNGENLQEIIDDSMRESKYIPVLEDSQIVSGLTFNLGFLDYRNGVASNYNGGEYAYTDFIEIPPLCDTIEHNTIPFADVTGWALYDKNRVFISGGQETVITKHTGAKFIRFANYSQEKNHEGKSATFFLWRRMRDVESMANSGGKKPMLLHIMELGQSLGQGRTGTYMDVRVDTNNAFMFKRLRTYDFGYALGITTEQYNANQDFYDAQFYDLEKVRLLEEEKTKGNSATKWVDSSDGEQESPASGIVEGILNMYKAQNVNELPFKVICTLSGLSGCDVDEFIPGARCYERTCIDIKYAFALANKWGYAYKPVIVYMQGENQSAYGESQEDFKTSLENVYNGLNDYLKNFGIDDGVKMFTYQTFSAYTSAKSHGVALAQMQLNNETTWCKMCYPNYAWRHGTDGIHLTPQASRAMGNSVGVAIFQDLEGDFETLKIERVEKDGNNLIVRFNKTIKVDKDHMDNHVLDDPTAKDKIESNWGFFPTDADNVDVFMSIEEVGTSAVKITCSELPAMLTYGFDPTSKISNKTLGGYIREDRVLKGYRNVDDLYLYMPIQQIKQEEFKDKFLFTVL